MAQENKYVMELVEDLEYHIEKMYDALLSKEWKSVPDKFIDQLFSEFEDAWKQYLAIEEDIRDPDIEDRLLNIEKQFEKIDE